MDFNNFLFQLNQDNILNAVSNDFSVRQVMFSNHFDQMSLYLSISFTERFFSPRQDPSICQNWYALILALCLLIFALQDKYCQKSVHLTDKIIAHMTFLCVQSIQIGPNPIQLVPKH